MKFWIFSYFAQITPIVSCFRKYHSKVLKRFRFFEIEESSKIAILAPRRYRKKAENCAFSFRSKRSTRQYLSMYFESMIVNVLVFLKYYFDLEKVFFLIIFKADPNTFIGTLERNG